MPPSYKPLPVTQAAMPPLIQEIFNRRFTDLNDSIASEQKIDQSRIANESNQIKLDQSQRAVDQEKAIREALVQQYGGENPTQQFDPEEALKTAQRIAYSQGDLDTGLNIEKIQKSRRADRGYSPEEKASLEEAFGYKLPDNVDPSFVGTMIKLQSANTYQQQVNDPLLARNRDLNAQKKEQDVTGTGFRAVGEKAISGISANDDFIDSIKQTRDLLANVEPGAFSALKAGRLSDIYKDPSSTAYRLYARLELLQKQVARMNDSGALTQLDVDMFKPFTLGSPIYDDVGSISQRLDDLEVYAAQKRQNIITNNEKGYRNMDRFKIPAPTTQAQGYEGGTQIPKAPSAQGGELPRNAQNKPLSREEFMALRGGR